LGGRAAFRWLAFRRYRTRNDGHYDLEYTFRRTTKPTIYEMRAQVRETPSYPYEQGDSDPLIIKVVPERVKPAARKPAAAKRRCERKRRAARNRSAKRCQAKRQAHRVTAGRGKG
jgi:hypothetical protein